MTRDQRRTHYVPPRTITIIGEKKPCRTCKQPKFVAFLHEGQCPSCAPPGGPA